MTGDGRPFIDDKGRLFGAVNIIDALVVFFVSVIVFGGIWFVAFSEPGSTGEPDGADGGPPTELRYATLDIGTLSPLVASQIEVGDTVQTTEDSTLTITDIYRAPAGTPTGDTTNDLRVFVRVELKGVEVMDNGDTRFRYAGKPPRISRTLTLTTDRYKTTGRILSVELDGPELVLTTVETVLDVTMSATTYEQLAVGDRYTVAGETIATVESLEAFKSGDPDVREALIGIEYVTMTPTAGVQPTFGTTTIREGATLPFETATYNMEGTVQRLGALEPRGEVTTRTVTLELDSVGDSRVEGFETGMTDQIGNETYGELIEVESAKNTETETYTVTMTAELRVRETSAGARFKNAPLHVGEQITLEFENTTVRPTVLSR